MKIFLLKKKSFKFCFKCCNTLCIFNMFWAVFHSLGALVENARPSYILDFMAEVHHSEQDNDHYFELLMDDIT